MKKHPIARISLITTFCVGLVSLVPSISYSQAARPLFETLGILIEKTAIETEHTPFKLPDSTVPLALQSLKRITGCTPESLAPGMIDSSTTVPTSSSIEMLICSRPNELQTVGTNGYAPFRQDLNDSDYKPISFYDQVGLSQGIRAFDSFSVPVQFNELIYSSPFSAGARAPEDLLISSAPMHYQTFNARDAVPYKEKVESIISRLKADQLSGVGATPVIFKGENEAFLYAENASHGSPSRRRFGATLEATQTWFQSEELKPTGQVGIFIHMVHRFDTEPLSAILFELSPRSDRPCQSLPKHGSYYLLAAKHRIDTGDEIVFVARLPESSLLRHPNMKCGTVVEAW